MANKRKGKAAKTEDDLFLEGVVDDVRQTMEDQKIQEGIDSTSPEGEDAIFIKKRSYENGGRVRGAGVARKGVRQCKMR